jgi:hypothetical protein
MTLTQQGKPRIRTRTHASCTADRPQPAADTGLASSSQRALCERSRPAPVSWTSTDAPFAPHPSLPLTGWRDPCHPARRYGTDWIILMWVYQGRGRNAHLSSERTPRPRGPMMAAVSWDPDLGPQGVPLLLKPAVSGVDAGLVLGCGERAGGAWRDDNGSSFA